MTERELFEKFYRDCEIPLYRFAHQYISDEDDCHDVVANAFEQLWAHIGNVNEQTVKAYLYTIVRNGCIDLIRRRDMKSRYADFVEIMSERYISSQRYEEQQYSSHVVNKILEALPSPPTREIFVACYGEDKKYREVAEEMKMTMANVKKHMVKALRIVREIKNSVKTVT